MLLTVSAAGMSAAPADAARPATAPPGGPGVAPFTLIVLAVGLSPDVWLEETPPFLRHMADRGGIALLSTRTDGPYTTAAALLTLGAGGPSRAGRLAGLALEASEHHLGLPAAVLYRQRTLPGARTPVPGEGIFHLGFWEQEHLNAPRPSGSRPGRLGQEWARRNLRVAVLGNSDDLGEKRRYGALLAMDGGGLVPRGQVGAHTLVTDPEFPFGPRTDYDKLLTLAPSLAAESDVLVVELGDLFRLQQFYPYLSEAVYRFHRQRVVERIDRFLEDLVGQLAQSLPQRPLHLWFLAPGPALPQRGTSQQFSPFAWAYFPAPRSGTHGAPLLEAAGSQASPESGSSNGLLLSPSTRRPGLVTAADFIPAILAVQDGSAPYFRSAPPGVLARHLPRPLPPDADPWAALAVFYRRAVVVNEQRPPILRAYVFFTIGVLLAWSLGTALRGRSPDPRNQGIPQVLFHPGLWRQLLLFILAVPLALLLLPLWQRESLVANMALTVLLAGALTGAAQAGRDRASVGPFLRLSWASAVLIALDVLRGAPWMKNSFLGYDPILGARFYGLGNEYMGFFIGSLLVASAGSLETWLKAWGPRSEVLPLGGLHRLDRALPGGSGLPARPAFLVLGCLYVLAALLILWPRGGANVGGFLSALPSFGLTFFLLWNGGPRRNRYGPACRENPQEQGVWNRRAAALVLPCLAGVLGILWLVGKWDAAQGADAAHLGQLIQALEGEGATPFLDTVRRKLHMNMRLLRHTIWSRVFLLSLAITAWLLLWPPRSLRRVFIRHRFLAAGLQGAVLASVIAFLVNDSGVVAAATAMIPATTTLLHLVSTESSGGRGVLY